MFKVEVSCGQFRCMGWKRSDVRNQGKAEEYARDLFMRWTAVKEWRVVEVPQ